MIMSQDFFYTYFVHPILQGGFFNPVNTIVLSIILLVAIYFVYKMLVKLKIRIDWKFFIGLLPFFFWGSSTRVLRDHTYNEAFLTATSGGISPTVFRTATDVQMPYVFNESASYVSQFAGDGLGNIYGAIITFFPTPGSYIITFIFALVALLIALAIQRYAGISYWKPLFIMGLIAVLFNIYIFLPIQNYVALGLILGTTIGITFIFYILSFAHKLHPKLKGFTNVLTPVNIGIIAAHLLDASATFYSLAFYGYIEQHVVPRLFFGMFGPVSFFALKIIVLIPVLYIIDKYADQRDFRNFLKIAIFILGFAPGLRDLLRLIVAV